MKKVHQINFLIFFFLFTFLLTCKVENQGLDGALTFLNNDTSPKIVLASPGMGEKNLGRDTKIGVLFSKEMNINSCVQSFSIVPGSLGYYNLTDISLEFIPSELLQFGSYTYTITKNCEAKDGADLKDVFSANFTVGNAESASLFPVVNSIEIFTGTNLECNTGAATKQNILANDVTTACMGNPNRNEIDINFSRSMDQAKTIQAIQITPNFNSTFTWLDETTLRILPDQPFPNQTRISIAVGLQATDSNGKQLLAPVFRSFYVGSGNLVPVLNSLNIFSGTLADCNSGIAIQNDILLATISNACLGNPNYNSLVFEFSRAMNRSQTEAALSISPLANGVYTWANGDTQLTITFDAKLTYGTRYNIALSSNAQSSDEILIGETLRYSFVAGGPQSNFPQVQAVGVASQGCSNTFPGLGSNVGGNWLLGSCYWDNSLPLLSASSYTFRAGDDGSGLAACADQTSDNFRLIFSDYMEVGSTLNALRLRRISPPSTIVQLSSWQWSDCQAVFPFGCRVLTLAFAEQESSCNGILFGDAGTFGDFNLLRSDNTPIGYPFYQISVDATARNVLNIPMQSNFNFTVEAK